MEQSSDNRWTARDANGYQDKAKDISPDVKYNNFMEIIKRREEKLTKLSSDTTNISKITLSVVFGDEKMLRNLLKIVIIKSQRKSQIKFEKLVKPL